MFRAFLLRDKGNRVIGGSGKKVSSPLGLSTPKRRAARLTGNGRAVTKTRAVVARLDGGLPPRAPIRESKRHSDFASRGDHLRIRRRETAPTTRRHSEGDAAIFHGTETRKFGRWRDGCARIARGRRARTSSRSARDPPTRYRRGKNRKIARCTCVGDGRAAILALNTGLTNQTLNR